MRQNRNNKIKKKLKTNDKIVLFTLFLAFLVFFVFLIRLFKLQILDSYSYKSKGNNISMVGERIKPSRGNIYDRNGIPLAISQNVESLYLLPVTTKEKSEEAENIRNNEDKFKSLSKEDQDYYIKLSSIPVYKEEDIKKIGDILNIDYKEILDMISQGREGYIYNSLNKSQKSQLELLNLGYLRFITQRDRYYPNGEVLSNTLGFLDNNVANYGLENYYDKLLSGKEGYREYFKAIQGTEIPFTKNKSYNPTQANNLMTTIDINLQQILYNRLKEAFLKYTPLSATAVLTDPNTGEILALESIPTFNANNPREFNNDVDKIFLKSIDKDKQSQYLISRWNNKAVSMTYEPGSVYKTITTSIVLESSNKLKNKVYQDNGFYNLGEGIVIESWRYWDPHGPQKLKEALKNSSNPVFAQIAQDVGKTKYIKYAQAYRLGKLSGIDLPNEQEGFYPKDDTLTDIDFGTLSFGYYATVNPVQFISSLNSIVNGGKYYIPHIGSKILDNNQNTVYKLGDFYKEKTVSEDTSKEVNEYLEYTAEDYGLNTKELKFGAKTGTAYKNILENPMRNKNKENIDARTSIFVTYPASKPKYTLLVVLDEPLNATTSSTTAFPVAKNIIYDVVNYDMGKKVDLKVENKLVKVPELSKLTIQEANQKIKDSNIKLEIEGKYGSFNVIKDQYPKSGNSIESGLSIKVKVDNNVKMPNLVGMSLQEAEKILKENGFKYKVSGNGNIIKKTSKLSDQIFSINEEIIITLGD